MPTFTEEEIKSCLPSLKAVFYGAGTVQAFARPFLNCGVKVFSAWAANAVPVAEYTVAQIVLANKGFFSSSRIAKTGNRKAAKEIFQSYPGNYNVKIGIIGAGMIGKLVINMLKSYRFEVLVFDPFLPDEKANELKVKKASLETIFRECQVVSNHLANNEQTKGMLDGKLFETMLPYSTFINTGRGAQVVETDLITVLKERPDMTALLDVTFPEPPEHDSEFYTLPNCILTPHIAGSAGNEVRRMGEYMLEEHQNFIQNKPCKYQVTLEMLKTMA
jgi:phosphoglycerate dehydrogenase-like enzyme